MHSISLQFPSGMGISSAVLCFVCLILLPSKGKRGECGRKFFVPRARAWKDYVIEYAKAGLKNVDLSMISKPHRLAASKLYKKL